MTQTTSAHEQWQVDPAVPESFPNLTPSPREALPSLLLREFETEMLDLSHAIDAQLPHHSSKIIQFIGSQIGEGVSTVCQAFATVSAVRLNKTVLFIEDRMPSPLRFSSLLEPPQSQPQALASPSFAPANAPTPSHPQSTLLRSPHLGDVFNNLRQLHDLVVVDSPPISTSSDGLAISRHADGIVLVIEAEQTRTPTVQKTKDRLLKSGAKILGTVLNKRRYYIPPYIYRFF